LKLEEITERLGVTRWALFAYGFAIVAVFLDQLVKGWMMGAFAHACPPGHIGKCSLHVLPFIDFTAVWNPGMSFGILSAQGQTGRWFLTVFAIAATAGLAYWARKADKAVFAWAMGLLMAGAAGNVIDRFRFGAVVDFIDVTPLLPFFIWIFNTADVFITLGATLLLAEAFLPGLVSRLASGRESGT
jgi:signal peptidase II